VTDRELLEAAAKAQGWIDFPTDSGEGRSTWYFDATRAPFGPRIAKRYWDPLTDGAQALQLATNLGMSLSLNRSDWVRAVLDYDAVAVETIGLDKHAAVNRAIVRCAAKHWNSKC